MKKFTEKEVMNALIENQSLEPDYDGSFTYYLHYKDGELVGSIGDGVETFTCEARYVDDLLAECKENHPEDEDAANDEFLSRVYDMENTDNGDFVEVVKDLTQQINEYIDENEE